MPPPHSSSLPKECEAILRSQGVTPATIAIIDGRIKVGLTEAELDRLAEMGFAAKKDGGESLWKVGRRELAAAVIKVSQRVTGWLVIEWALTGRVFVLGRALLAGRLCRARWRSLTSRGSRSSLRVELGESTGEQRPVSKPDEA